MKNESVTIKHLKLFYTILKLHWLLFAYIKKKKDYAFANEIIQISE